MAQSQSGLALSTSSDTDVSETGGMEKDATIIHMRPPPAKRLPPPTFVVSAPSTFASPPTTNTTPLISASIAASILSSASSSASSPSISTLDPPPTPPTSQVPPPPSPFVLTTRPSPVLTSVPTRLSPVLNSVPTPGDFGAPSRARGSSAITVIPPSSHTHSHTPHHPALPLSLPNNPTFTSTSSTSSPTSTAPPLIPLGSPLIVRRYSGPNAEELPLPPLPPPATSEFPITSHPSRTASFTVNTRSSKITSYPPLTRAVSARIAELHNLVETSLSSAGASGVSGGSSGVHGLQQTAPTQSSNSSLDDLNRTYSEAAHIAVSRSVLRKQREESKVLTHRNSVTQTAPQLQELRSEILRRTQSMPSRDFKKKGEQRDAFTMDPNAAKDLLEKRPANSGVSDALPHSHRKLDCRSLAHLSLTAFGVIFGDIGTSPLYVFTSVFANPPSSEQTKGALSLIIWSLFLIVFVKYVTCILNADAHGEGGTFALLSLLKSANLPPWRLSLFTYMAFFGASMLLGDGVITPAISVLSAVEGIAVNAPGLEVAIVPITVVILFILFLVQRFGTEGVGRYFGPIMVLWFMSLAIIGLYNIINEQQWEVFEAFSPHYGWNLLTSPQGFSLLGGVVLSVTGTEALFADLGHFGTLPIRLTWSCLVFPSLILNYLGQASVLITRPDAIANTFFYSVPFALQWPMVVLSTMATVIASQALLTGANSLMNAAVKLEFFPRVKTVHTSKHVEGQIYIPEINYALMVVVIIVVIGFQHSARLASAYGVAVCTDMLFTTIFFINVMGSLWKTAWWKIALYAVVFLTVDGVYLAANLRKVPEGGWLPLIIAFSVATIMVIWHKGRQLLLQATKDQSLQLQELLDAINEKSTVRVAGTGLFFTAQATAIPAVVKQLMSRLHALPQRTVFLHIRIVDAPFVLPTYPYSTALDIEDLGYGLYFACATYGYAATKIMVKNVADDIINVLYRLDNEKRKQNLEVSTLFQKEEPAEQEGLETITYFVGRDSVVAKKGSSLGRRLVVRAYNFLAQNSRDFANFYHIPPNDLIELGYRLSA